MARIHDEARLIAADLPDEIRFGTSSWSFPGWKGIVYSGSVTASAIARDGLRQYDTRFHAEGTPDAHAVIPALDFQLGDARFRGKLNQLPYFVECHVTE